MFSYVTAVMSAITFYKTLASTYGLTTTADLTAINKKRQSLPPA